MAAWAGPVATAPDTVRMPVRVRFASGSPRLPDSARPRRHDDDEDRQVDAAEAGGRPAGVSVICALDHGMTSPTFLEPLADIEARARETVAGGANVIMMSKGMIRVAEPAFSPTTSLALLLSASANPGGDRPEIVQIAEVEEALVLGADAVVLFTALGGDTEPGMIDILSSVGRECAALGMPFIAEAEFPTTYATVEELKQQYGFEYLRRSVRLCAELGADIVKTNWPGDAESFGKLVEATNGIPVVLAGGSRLEDKELLWRMQVAVEAGAIGCSVGRNIFMHASPEAITRALSRVIRERWSADKAHEALVGELEGEAPVLTVRSRGRADEGGAHDRRERRRGAGDRGSQARPPRRVLKVEACGICGTDARTFFNGDPRAPAPWVLGHEPVGVLEEVGPDAVLPPGVREGDRVFVGSILTCGECRWCVEGFQNLCEHHLLYGYDPFPGAYAEWAAVPPIATKNLIPLPDELPSDLATVADPFACALNGVEMLDVRLGDRVVILGTGPIGCWQAVMCRDRGASRIYLSDVNRERLDVALGVVGDFVDDAWVAGEDNGVAEVLSRTGGAGAERVSVAAPSKQAQQAALEMAAKRARVVYFAGLPKHDPVSPLDMNQLHYKELAILGAYGATHRQYRITMDYLDRRQEDLAPVVTHRFPLEQIARRVRDDPLRERD